MTRIFFVICWGKWTQKRPCQKWLIMWHGKNRPGMNSHGFQQKQHQSSRNIMATIVRICRKLAGLVSRSIMAQTLWVHAVTVVQLGRQFVIGATGGATFPRLAPNALIAANGGISLPEVANVANPKKRIRNLTIILLVPSLWELLKLW